MDVNPFSPELANDPNPRYREVGQPVKNGILGFWMITTQYVRGTLRSGNMANREEA